MRASELQNSVEHVVGQIRASSRILHGQLATTEKEVSEDEKTGRDDRTRRHRYASTHSFTLDARRSTRR